MNEIIQEKIESYLGGTMSSEEQSNFENMLETSSELKEELELYKEINFHLSEELWSDKVLKSNDHQKTELKAYFRSEEGQQIANAIAEGAKVYKNEKPPKSFPFLKFASIAVVLFIVGFFSYYLLHKDSYADLYMAYNDQTDLPSLVTRGVTTEIQRGVIAYQNEDYSAALQKFSTYLSQNPNPNPAVYLYLSKTQLALGNSDNALESLETLAQSESLEKDKILWFKVLIYLKTENKELLKATLTEITSDASNYRYEEAKQLLKEV